MKCTLVLLATLLTALPLSAAAVEPPLLPPRVDKAIHERIDAGEYPAMVVAVVDGKRSHIYAFGKLANGKAPDANTVFEIGSITKTFTATLLAQQVLAGNLKLDTPVADLLPGFSVPSRDGKTITLENLATQHSGLPRLPNNIKPTDIHDPYADYNGEALKTFLAGYKLQRNPGSAYEYSNLGVGLLGYALAQRAHMTYGELLHKRIFAPLGMHSSATELDAVIRAHLAAGHDADGKPAENWQFKALAGAGAIKSTAADMLRYLKANMGQLKTPLYPAMQLAHKPREDARAERIGLIWMTQPGATKGSNVIWHNGMTGGYASFLGFTADGQHGVVVLTNTQQSVDDIGFAVLSKDAPLAAAHKRIALLPKTLDEYVGSYRLAPGFILKAYREKDQLYMQATGQSPLPMYANARDEFFAHVAAISVSFKRDATGKVDSLILHQNGDHAAPRLSDAEAEAASGQHEIKLKAATLAEYVGHYQLAPAVLFDVTLKHGQLMVQLTGQSAYPVFASARDQFFLKVVDAQITFQRGDNDKVDALVLHQAGMDQRAPRVDK